MAAYFIVEIEVHDPVPYAEYLRLVPPLVAKHGGRYLVRGGEVTPVFGGWEPKRLVVIEFPSAAHIRAWLGSPEYREVAPYRERSTSTKAIIVEGGTQPAA